ncbi:MAG: DNA-formamidopyrimidine glycosylase family protein [Nocardioidaceae bacterium]
MPEGDTVWRAARHLHQALSGDELVQTDFRVPAYATVDLAGQTVTETLARGKHLLTRIGPVGGGQTLHTHLKMEGAWHLYRPGTAWKRPAHEARVVLRTEEWTAVGFALGVVEVVPRADEAVRRLLARPDRPVAEALLDQRNLAGIGNLYKSELCFLAGVSPWRPVGDVPDLPKLVQRAKAALEANKDRVTQTTTGDLRRGAQTYV